MEKSELLSVKEASEILGISPATVKNWIKLGKIKGHKNGSLFLLSREAVEAKSKELSGSHALRSRRNKSRLTSNFIPKSYISNSSPNYITIKKLLTSQALSNHSLNNILAFYAKALMEKAGISYECIERLLEDLVQDASISCTSDLEQLSKELAAFPLTLINGEDTLGMLYLSLRSMQDKKATGAYYTPYFVVDELIKKALDQNRSKELSNSQILDPACGTGNFLLRLPDTIPLPNLHGYDIDPVAVYLTRINLAIKYKVNTDEELSCLLSGIRTLDFLLGDNLPHKDFDIVIGNPPWGYAFDSSQIAMIKQNSRSFDGSGKPESFSLFIEKALSHGHNIAFLLPETILSSDYHQGIREYILSCGKVQGISYLGEAFDKVQCPSVILCLSKDKQISAIDVSFYKKASQNGKELKLLRNFKVEQTRITYDNFNILADNSEYEIIRKMEETPHFTLKGNCDFALGIVTGANKSLLTDHETSGSEPIIKGKDISKYRIDTGKSYTVFEPWRYQQVAPEKFYRAKNKLFYRFIAAEPVVALDNEGLVSLNSANIMIPHFEGYSNAYIMAILNSSAISFYYKHTCKNMKVLRSVLEALPIPVCTPDQQAEIETLAIKLMDSSKNATFSNDCLIKRLDYLISKLYNLNTDDIEYLLK